MAKTGPHAIPRGGKIHRTVGDMIINGMQQSFVDVSQSHSKMLKALGQIFDKPRTDVARKTELHRRIGKRGQDAVLASYAQTVTARKKVASYRVNEGRYAGGALRRAIASPKFFKANAEGLEFIDRKHLDQEAEHWHRLNFGAGPRANQGRPRQLFQVRWGGLVAATLGLDDGPSGPVLMPLGVFGDVEGAGGASANKGFKGSSNTGQAFTPIRKPVKFRTQGIAARRFLDTGVREIARLLPLAYQDYYREVYKEVQADKDLHPLRHVVNAKPSGQKSSVKAVSY